MIVTCVMIDVKKENLEEFIAVSKANHEGSVKETGNLRFDVLQSADDPTKFMLYEAYESEAAVKAHKETPHYLAWKKAVETWMASPRRGVPYKVIAPESKDGWKR